MIEIKIKNYIIKLSEDKLKFQIFKPNNEKIILSNFT